MDRRTFLAVNAAVAASGNLELPTAECEIERPPSRWRWTPGQIKILDCKLPRAVALGGNRSGKTLAASTVCRREAALGKRVAAIAYDQRAVERVLRPEFDLPCYTGIDLISSVCPLYPSAPYDFVWLDEAISQPQAFIRDIEGLMLPGGRILWTSCPSPDPEQRDALLRWPVIANLRMQDNPSRELAV